MTSTNSDFVDRTSPLKDRLNLYKATQSPLDQPDNDTAEPHKAIPQGFIDCMIVREEVYVKEQNIPLENELDEDDARSYHWVAYASIGNSVLPRPDQKPTSPTEANSGNKERKDSTHPAVGARDRKSSTSTKIPVGTIRLVPPPHAPRPEPKPGSTGSDEAKHISPHDNLEPYIKLGRLAVLPPFRKAGLSRLLIDTALTFARQNPWEMIPQYPPHQLEALKQEAGPGGPDLAWRGLVCVHSQIGVQKLWRRYGFETDRTMGEWDEEGIQHVGMWRRLTGLSEQRRLSKPFVTSP